VLTETKSASDFSEATKVCKDCGLSKSLTEFYLNKNETDGHARICKEDAKRREYDRRRAKGIPLKNQAQVDENFRICGTCGLTKSVLEFYPRTDRKVGYKSDCIDCIIKKREKHRRSKGIQPFYENKECSQYLGVHIGEHQLAKELLESYFKHVPIQMKNNNRGFDFTVDGYRVQVKTGSMVGRHFKNGTLGWQFCVYKNKVVDYFLLIAIDDRDKLNKLYSWLVPGTKLNHLIYATISETTLGKWDKWKLSSNGLQPESDI
jgi:hypothetical protein